MCTVLDNRYYYTPVSNRLTVEMTGLEPVISSYALRLLPPYCNNIEEVMGLEPNSPDLIRSAVSS